ncbi:MAG: hypothetical protein H6700_06025 [Myxococcales bacterium]|nr:hypothetical protein [Myxococcales bacterium]MCB9531303.1 hypothetical protein [Myxococcales bacterium]
MSPSSTRRPAAEALGLLVPFVAMALVMARFFEWDATPTEDAAILMRYAQHLAEGHGIVWNIGEPPVDGATDFLFMLAITALMKLGAPLAGATRALVIGAHAVTVAIVYGRVRRSGFAIPVASTAAGFLAVGPGLSYAEAYFGTPFFAMWVAAMWAVAVELRSGYRPTLAVACALLALGAGLTRPDGVLLAGLVFVALAAVLPRREALGVFAAFAAVFGTLGIGYFAWRWSYFGFPLPNPYYKKGEFHLWVGSFVTAVQMVVRFLLPLLPLYALALGERRALREAIFSAIPIVGFTAVWILVSDEMNFLGRFQYAVVPIAAISAPGVGRAVLSGYGLHRAGVDRRATWVAAAVAAAALVGYPALAFRPSLPGGLDARTVIGRGLAPLAERGYTVVTTEAGLLPLTSGWRSIDAWGLNDATIAHAGRMSDEYLAAQAPAFLLVHAAGSPVFDDPTVGADLGPEWDAMTDQLVRYCRSNGYTLAAAWGASHTDTFQFWVSPRIAEHDQIVALVREARFDFLGGRGVFVDWAGVTGELRRAPATVE